MLTLANHFFRQSFFLGKPELTENNLPSQEGRVVIITGGYTGVGLELAKILYRGHATIYIAGRSTEKAEKGIEAIKKSSPDSKGKLDFMKFDLGDLTTVKPAVEAFLKKESKLHVLINNAGVMFPPPGSKTAQGHDLQLGTNCLGHFLLAKLLTPILEKTAASSPKDSVRISWAGSMAVDLLSPTGGITFDAQGNPQPSDTNIQLNYGLSKVGNYFYGKEYARRHPIPAGGKGVVNTSFNPGNLRTELQRHTPRIQAWVLDKLLLYPAVFGAYTELWAGWQPDVPNGSYVWPWGKVGGVKPDVGAELKEGGNAEKFWEWSERETKAYV